MAEKPVTVFSFDPAQIRLEQGANYDLEGGDYAPRGGGAAATFSAKATLKPAGLNCKAPQIRDLRIGIMQEYSDNILMTTIWDTPKIAWKRSAKKGAAVTVWESQRVETTFAPVQWPVNFSGVYGAQPLWDDGPRALKPPIPCAGAGAATSDDTMVVSGRPTQDTPGGKVTYTNHVQSTLKATFRTFCVVYNKKTKQFCALRQADWSLDLDSEGRAADQHADVDDHDNKVTKAPAKPQKLRMVAQEKNVGTATVTFTKQR